jgi:HEAT repeat protein
MGDLKSGGEKDQIIAARLLPRRKGDAAQVVPALIAALKNKAPDVRWSAAIGLGYFGEEAKEAVPALQTALNDHDARVREGAGVALFRIDPAHFKDPKAKPARGS